MENQHKLIKGYRDLTQSEIDKINLVKSKAEDVEQLIESIEVINGIDGRWVSIGRTHLQQGFMALIRGITQPETF